MQMSPGEIRMRHKYAVDKSEHVTILAQLNCCSQQMIRMILAGHDDAPEPKKLKYARVNYDMVRELYGKGLNDTQIANEVGAASESLIRGWRAKNGFPKNVNVRRKCRAE